MREDVFRLEAEREGDRGPVRGAVRWACIWLRAVSSAAIGAAPEALEHPLAVLQRGCQDPRLPRSPGSDAPPAAPA